jgi:hypothetical protein
VRGGDRRIRVPWYGGIVEVVIVKCKRCA